MIVGIDGTPLTVSSGGVRRYTEELTRALRLEFPEDRYELLSDQLQPVSGPRPTMVDSRRAASYVQTWMRRVSRDRFFGALRAAPPVRPDPSRSVALDEARMASRGGTRSTPDSAADSIGHRDDDPDGYGSDSPTSDRAFPDPSGSDRRRFTSPPALSSGRSRRLFPLDRTSCTSARLSRVRTCSH